MAKTPMAAGEDPACEQAGYEARKEPPRKHYPLDEQAGYETPLGLA